jgi:hypothetical protein
MSLFSIDVLEQPKTEFKGLYGAKGWNDAGARKAGSREGFLRALGKPIRDNLTHHTFESNFLKLDLSDLNILDQIFDHYLGEIKPALMALPGDFGWTGKGKNQTRRSIKVADGMTYNSREEAARATLKLLMQDAARTYIGVHPWLANNGHPKGLGQPQLSAAALLHFANEYFYDQKTLMERILKISSYRIFHHFEDMLKVTDRCTGKPIPDVEERFAKAIKAAIKGLTTPAVQVA